MTSCGFSEDYVPVLAVHCIFLHFCCHCEVDRQAAEEVSAPRQEIVPAHNLL